jgi:Arc/MetJ-type ribon-helix-helix transcriptional regulator
MKVSFDLPQPALDRLDRLVFSVKQRSFNPEDFPYRNRAEFLRDAVLRRLAEFNYIKTPLIIAAIENESLSDE